MKLLRRGLKRLLDNRLVYFSSRGNPDGIVLTFDDGPDPERTPAVLELLDQYRAKAVFFPIGRKVELHPKLTREIRDRGHLLGNHTYSHLDAFRGGGYSRKQYLQEILHAQRVIRDCVDIQTELFRPPRGELNLSNVSAIWQSGHKIVYWSIEAGEWGRRQHEPGDVLADDVVKNIRLGDVLLLHDNNDKTLTVLEQLLPHARDSGWDISRGLRI